MTTTVGGGIGTEWYGLSTFLSVLDMSTVSRTMASSLLSKWHAQQLSSGLYRNRRVWRCAYISLVLANGCQPLSSFTDWLLAGTGRVIKQVVTFLTLVIVVGYGYASGQDLARKEESEATVCDRPAATSRLYHQYRI